MVRKLGGFTFQELNLTVDDIAAMGQGGADLSYDFITRPAYHHALVTGDTEFLRRMLRTVHDYGIHASRQIQIPDTQAPGLLVMVHALPDDQGIQVMALNFGSTGLDESVVVDHAQPGPVVDMFTDQDVGQLTGAKELPIRLAAFEGRSYLIR